MNRSEHRTWFRSSPLFGVLGGLLTAAWVHRLGSQPEPAFLLDLLRVRALFAVSPVLGYVTLAVVGGVLGFVFRRLEDRYVYPD